MQLRAREHRHGRRRTETGAGKEGAPAAGVENRNERRGEREEAGDPVRSADGKDAGWEREGQGDDPASLALVTGGGRLAGKTKPTANPTPPFGGTTESDDDETPRVRVSQILLNRTITHPPSSLLALAITTLARPDPPRPVPCTEPRVSETRLVGWVDVTRSVEEIAGCVGGRASEEGVDGMGGRSKAGRAR